MLSYGLIILNAVYGIVLMPYIIGQIGQADYGVYKTISAFTSALMVLDLGTGNTAMRYIAKFIAESREDRIPGFIRALFAQGAVISVVIAVISGGIYLSLDTIYKNGLSASEITKAKQLFIFLGLTVIFHVFENILNGIITGYNRFIFANGCKFARLAIRIITTYILLVFLHDSLVLVIIDMCLVLFLILLELIYIKTKLKVRFSGGKIEKTILLQSFKYTITVFTASILSQVQSNLDNVVIGALKSSVEVTVYSVALQFFNMYQQIGSSISGVMLPTVINSLENDDGKMTQTQHLIVQTGRIQFILLGAAFAGFAALGREFIPLLMGSDGYGDVYCLSLILMLPAMLEMCTNVCLAVLRAKNILKFYTVMLLVSMLINLLVTLVGTYFFNYYAAALGTAVSVVIGNLVMMNLFYHKRFGFNMLKLYGEVFKNTWLCILLGFAAAMLAKIPFSGLTQFIVGAAAFLAVYAAALLGFGLNPGEKSMVFSVINKLFKKKSKQ